MESLDKIYLIQRKGQDRRETWFLAHPPESGEFETFINATTIPETRIQVRVKALRDAAASDLLAACNDLVERINETPAYAAIDREGDYICPICYASIFSSGVTHEADCPIGRIEGWIAAAKGEQS